MPTKEQIKALRDYIRETSGGHSLSNAKGDLLWQTRHPINLTEMLEAIESADNPPFNEAIEGLIND